MECTVTISTSHIEIISTSIRSTKHTIFEYMRHELHAFNSVECFICVNTVKCCKSKPNGVQERACTTLIKSGHAPYINIYYISVEHVYMPCNRRRYAPNVSAGCWKTHIILFFFRNVFFVLVSKSNVAFRSTAKIKQRSLSPVPTSPYRARRNAINQRAYQIGLRLFFLSHFYTFVSP